MSCEEVSVSASGEERMRFPMERNDVPAEYQVYMAKY